MKDNTIWKFWFKISFAERDFNLAARTKREMKEWVRIFETIISMNK